MRILWMMNCRKNNIAGLRARISSDSVHAPSGAFGLKLQVKNVLRRSLRIGYSLTIALTLATPGVAQNLGHVANDIRGSFSAGSLTASQIISSTTFHSKTNAAPIAFCIFVTNGVPLVTWSGNITNIITDANRIPFAIVTNIDNAVTNVNAGGVPMYGATNAPAFYCEQIDNFYEGQTVWGHGLGGTAMGTYLIKCQKP